MTQHGNAQSWAPPPPAGTVEVGRYAPGVAIVSIDGEHDIGTQTVVARALEHASADSSVIVDLSRCEFFDSTVISELIKTSLVLEAQAEQLVLVIPPARAPSMRIAELSGLAQIVGIDNSLEGALARLQAAKATRAPATEVHS
jgi:anti-anti-sigma factor